VTLSDLTIQSNIKCPILSGGQSLKHFKSKGWFKIYWARSNSATLKIMVSINVVLSKTTSGCLLAQAFAWSFMMKNAWKSLKINKNEEILANFNVFLKTAKLK
jgi:hypothetical protein